MPLRISFGFPNPGIVNRGNPRAGSKLAWFLSILYILYSLEVGIFLIFLPWFDFWEYNYFVFRFPGLRPFINSPYLKGAVLGLGIVNLIIGFQEILRLRKGPGNYFTR
jgi:hypothetical protein